MLATPRGKPAGCPNQYLIYLEGSKVTDMQGIFEGASALKQKNPWRKDGYCSLM